MKNLKISLTTLVFAIILTISTGVFAANDLDLENKITMPSSLSNGKGTVSTSLSGNMKYQFVEISKAKYDQLVKYEYMMKVVKAYMNRQNDGEAYNKAVEEYKAKYNENVSAIKDGVEVVAGETLKYSFDEAGYRAMKSAWTHTIGAYNANAWIDSSDKTISVDTTTFDGTKYYVAFVNIGDVYDAQEYVVTGKKVEKSDEKNNETKNEAKPNTTKNNNTNTPKTISTGKSDGSSTASKLPHTGVSDVVLGALATISTVAGVSYVRYRKIK